MDIVSRRRRSEIMSRIGPKDTQPELVVRKRVHSLGFRYRLHSRMLPGSPDLVFRSRRKVIFVHGCFWHGHRGCPRAFRPSTRTQYWEAKLAANRARDARVVKELKRTRWKVLVIWECETRVEHLDD